MQNVRLYHSIRPMFLTLGAGVLAILLLESDGLENWANRLEPGPLSTVAQPAAAALKRTLQPLGIAGARDRTLDEAARMGWSDDAVRMARLKLALTDRPLHRGRRTAPDRQRQHWHCGRNRNPVWTQRLWLRSLRACRAA